jgi:uncharacterized membrane protein
MKAAYGYRLVSLSCLRPRWLAAPGTGAAIAAAGAHIAYPRFQAQYRAPNSASLPGSFRSAELNADMTARESSLRSLLKAITYRITGTITTALITYMVTGHLATALAVGSIEPFIKVIVYYAHERAWQRVPIGTVRRLAHLPRATDRDAT